MRTFIFGSTRLFNGLGSRMTAFRITNVQLIDPQKQTVTAGNITIKDGLIATDDPKASTLDGQGKCLAPGIVDVGVKDLPRPSSLLAIRSAVAIQSSVMVIFTAVTVFFCRSTSSTCVMRNAFMLLR